MSSADKSFCSRFYLSVAINSMSDPTFNEQMWWMYPIAKFFGHVLYGKLKVIVSSMLGSMLYIWLAIVLLYMHGCI